MPAATPELILIALIALLSGLFLGIGVSRLFYRSELQKDYDDAKNQMSEEREALSLEMTDHLVEIRNSIVQTARAYQGAVKTLEDKLALSPEKLSRLGRGGSAQLELEFKESAATNENPPIEHEIEVAAEPINESQAPLDEVVKDIPEVEAKPEPPDQELVDESADELIDKAEISLQVNGGGPNQPKAPAPGK